MLRSNFVYNGKSLSDFQMKMYDPDADPQGVERTIDKAAQNSAREVPNHYTTYRNGVLQHNMLVIKDPDLFESSNDLRLTEKEVHRIKSWLFSTTLPAELILPQDDEEIDVRYFGVFTNVQYFMPVRKTCFGLQLTFTCNAPYGFSPVISQQFNIVGDHVNGEYTASIGQFDRMMLPKIVIKASDGNVFNGETLKLINDSDDGHHMQITLVAGFHTIIIDCQSKVFTGVKTVDNVDVETPLTLTALGIELFGTSIDNGRSFQLLNLYGDLYWLTVLPGDNALKFETTVPDGESFRNYTVEIQTRQIIEAGGF